MSRSTHSSRVRGRDAERQILRNVLGEAVAGRPAVAVIEGEAGIGKTTLLEDALQAARGGGVQVLGGQAHELERIRPFGVLADALGLSRTSPDPRRAAIAELLASNIDASRSVTVSSDAGLRFRVVDAIVALIEALAEDGPLVIAIDDLQWADPSAVLTLATVARRLADRHVALLCCVRPIPRPDHLDRAIAALDRYGGRHVVLGPIADAAVVELVADTIGAEPGDSLMAEVAGAGGNPLFITEVLAATVLEKAIVIDGGVADIHDVSVLPSLRLTLLRSISYLPDDTLQALRSAAILGSRFSLTDLSIITGRPAIELFAALSPALDAGVVEGEDQRLRFRHDLLHEAIYGDLPEAILTALHRDAAQRLATAGAPVLHVAEHWARVATTFDPEAFGCLREAARGLSTTSPNAAIELFQRGIDLLDERDPQREQLMAEQAVTMTHAGRLLEAEQRCLSLLAGSRPESRLEVTARTCLGHTLIAQGRMPQALAHLDQLTHGSALVDGERAAAWGWTAMAQISLGHLNAAVDAANHARELATANDEHAIVSLALTCRAMERELRGDAAAAVDIIDDGVRLADASPARAGHNYPIHVARGHILIEADRVPDAIVTLESGMQISQQLGLRWPIPSFLTYLALANFVSGDWGACDTFARQALEVAAESGEGYSLTVGHAVMAMLALHRSDLRGAERASAAANGELAAGGQRFRGHWAIWVRSLVEEARGDETAAFRTLEECWRACDDLDLLGECALMAPDLVRLAWATGHQVRGTEVQSRISELFRDSAVHSHAAGALHCEGIVRDDASILIESAERYTMAGRPLHSAVARATAGASLTRRDAPTAIALLRQASLEFDRLGARREQARCRSALRELGVRDGVRGTRSRTRTGWGGLTPTERDIVDLVAQGLSNPQIGERLFISRRTVQSHLAHVFTKVGVASRAQLAAGAVRNSPSADQPESRPRPR